MDLEIENLSKRFNDHLAVQIPSLTIRHGEFFTFVGPSGSGKSTILNLIAGLEQSTTGLLRLGERLLNDLPPHKRDVAFVFQSYALYPHRTVSENLAFPLELARVPRETIRQRVHEVSSSLGIGPLLDKRPGQLSGGERQRVALGRAIIRHPHLFLFDEPLCNLDAPLRAQMRKELRELHQRLDTTFIYVTHDQEEALSLSDRIAVVRDGRIQQCDSPRAVYDQPANRFVASFFGSPPMNFFPAELHVSQNGVFVQMAGLRLHLDDISPLPAKTIPVTLGIRPEDVRISRESHGEGWPTRISQLELHGGQTYLELEMNGVYVTAVERADAGYRPGEDVRATVAIERLHLFDPQTGARLAHKVSAQ